MTHTESTTYADFADRLRTHLDQRRATGRPLLVTSDGKADAVVLSPDAFVELIEQADLKASLQMLDQSMADVAAGRITPANETLRELAAELNLTIHR